MRMLRSISGVCSIVLAFLPLFGSAAARFLSCTRHLHNHQLHARQLDQSVLHSLLDDVTGAALNEDEKSSVLYVIYDGLEEQIARTNNKPEPETTTNEEIESIICQETYEALYLHMGIDGGNQQEHRCVEWLGQATGPLDQQKFVDLSQTISSEQPNGLMWDVWMDFEDPDAGSVQDMSASWAQALCRRLRLADVLSASSRKQQSADSHSEPVPSPLVSTRVRGSIPAPAPTLRVQEEQVPTLISSHRRLNDDTPFPTLDDSEFGMCKFDMFTSNRKCCPRDNVISQDEFVFLLNSRFGLTLPTDTPFADLDVHFRDAYNTITSNSLNRGAAGIDITGTVPGTSPSSIPQIQDENLRFCCSELTRAYQKVLGEGSPTAAPVPPAPTQAPQDGATPAPTSSASFRNKCNVAVLLYQNRTRAPGIDSFEYVFVIRKLALDSSLGDGPGGNNFDALPSALKAPFESYGTSVIDVQGSSQTRSPELNEFCDRVHLGIERWLNPTPTASPTPMPTNPPDGGTQSPTAFMSNAQFNFCLDSLGNADGFTNQQGQNDDDIDQGEFVSFLNYLTTELFGGISSFSDLDLLFQNVFSNSASGGVIDITGAKDIGSASNQEESFLRNLCRDTFEAIREFNERQPSTPTTQPPTRSPTDNNQAACFQGMADADGDNSQTLDQSEYIAYVNSIGSNTWVDTDFDETPYILQDNYEWIIGLDETLDIDAAIFPSALPTQRTLLTAACVRTGMVVTSAVAGNDEVFRQDHCFAALTFADSNADDSLEESEFVSFVNYFLGIQYANSFNDLDPDFRRYFNSNKGSSNNAIGIDGSKPDQSPSQVQLLSLIFLCTEMESTVAGVREAFVTLEKCSLSVGAGNTNSDNTLTQAEYVVFIMTMADTSAIGVSFGDLSEDIQAFYSNFTAGLQQLESVTAWVNGGTLSDLQRATMVSVCGQADELARTIEPTPTNMTTIYSSFIISNNQSLTSTNLTNTSTDRQNLEDAYDAFVKSETAKLAASASRRRNLRHQRRRTQVLGVSESSPELYEVQDSDCPENVQGNGALCQTVYGRFELIHRNESSEAALQSQVENTLQQAIGNGNLQTSLDQVDPSSPHTVVGPGATTQPLNGTGRSDQSGGDDDDGISIPLLIAIIAGVGLCCCVAGVLLYLNHRKEQDSQPPPVDTTKPKKKKKKPSELPPIDEEEEDTSAANDLFKDEPEPTPPFGYEDDDYDDERKTEEGDSDESSEESEEAGLFANSNQANGEWNQANQQKQPEFDEEQPSYGREQPSYEQEQPSYGQQQQQSQPFVQQSQPYQQQPPPQQSWGSEPWATGASQSTDPSFFGDSHENEDQSTANQSAANKSMGTATAKSSVSGNNSGSGSGQSRASQPPPDQPFDNGFNGSSNFSGPNAFNAASAPKPQPAAEEPEEEEVVEVSEEDSSYDSEVAGEKKKPPAAAQALYNYEYSDEDFEGLSSSTDDQDSSYDETDSEVSDKDEDDEEEEEEEEEEAEAAAPSVDPEAQARFRETIEALVQEVVPDEIEHVDAMMEQFVGREEELINTLRNMTTSGSDDSSSAESSSGGSGSAESEESSEETSEEDHGGDGEYVEEEVEEEEYTSSDDSSYEEESVDS